MPPPSKVELQNKIKQLMGRLVTKIIGFEEGDDNFTISVDFVLENCQNHRFATTEWQSVTRSMGGIVEKYAIQSRVHESQALGDAYKAYQAMVPTTGNIDAPYDIIRLLLILASTSRRKERSVKALRLLASYRQKAEVEEQQVVQEIDPDIVAMNQEWEQDFQLSLQGERANIGFTEEFAYHFSMIDGSDEEIVEEQEQIFAPEQGLEQDPMQSDEVQHSELYEILTNLSPTSTSEVSKRVDRPSSHIAERPWNMLQSKLARRTTAGIVLAYPTIISERELVEEVELLLRGLSSELFVFDPTRQQFAMAPGKALDHLSVGSLHSLLNAFTQAAEKQRRIQDLVSNFQPSCGAGQCLQAFFGCVASVNRLHELLLQYDEKMKLECLPKTLISLGSFLQNEFECLRMLDPLVTQAAKWTSGRLLSHLHDTFSRSTMWSSGRVADLLGRLFVCTLKPYLCMLDRWTNDGVVEDPFQEFMVVENNVSVDATDYWANHFTLRKHNDGLPAVPSFLVPIAPQLLFTGKALNMLKLLDKRLECMRNSIGRRPLEALFWESLTRVAATSGVAAQLPVLSSSSDFATSPSLAVSSSTPLLPPVLTASLQATNLASLISTTTTTAISSTTTTATATATTTAAPTASSSNSFATQRRSITGAPPPPPQTVRRSSSTAPPPPPSGSRRSSSMLRMPPPPPVVKSVAAAGANLFSFTSFRFNQATSLFAAPISDNNPDVSELFSCFNTTLECEKSPSFFDSRSADYALLQVFTRATEFLQPVFQLIPVCLLRHLTARHDEAAGHLRRVLIDDCHLFEQFQALREAFLLQHPGVRNDMTDLLFAKLENNRDTMAAQSLSAGLVDSVRASPLCDTYLAGDISVEVDASATKPFMMLGLKLVHKVSWPRNMVIGPDATAKYNQVFVLLLQVLLAKQALEKVTQESTKAKRTPITHQFFCLKSQFYHFVVNLHSFLMTNVIDDAWTLFQKSIEGNAEADFATFQVRHNAYLDRILDRGLLLANVAYAKEALLKTLELSLELKRLYNLILQSSANLAPQLSALHGEFQRTMRVFLTACAKLVSAGTHPHLEDLLVRLDFNSFYDITPTNPA